MAVLLFVKPPAPSGLPYSSTNSINLVDASYPDQSGNYPKITGYFSTYTDAIGTITTNQFGTLFNGEISDYYFFVVFNVTNNRWELGNFGSYGEGEFVWNTFGANLANNPSTNQNFIPTSGWSRNIVITAGV
jgi:hypothetical protein